MRPSELCKKCGFNQNNELFKAQCDLAAERSPVRVKWVDGGKYMAIWAGA